MVRRTRPPALGQLIRDARNELGLSQRGLADRIKRDPQTVSRIERGETVPSLETLRAIARALETTVAELLGDAA